ncbi:GNAT family N-acetyltransferase [Modestobacter roseus]|uniref:GNAT family N-acetyltransferase n=1 Tax=Modestobacter roseus TaxID=1181884 RepID=UPI0034DF8FFC
MSRPTASVATPADLPEIGELRHRVFVLEQGVPAELERDAADATAVHALSRDDSGRVVATGRLLLDAAGPGRAVIGRMAADAGVRGRGHGAAVLAALHRAAAERGQAEVELHAQVTARRFYARAGYVPVGAEYLEAGIVHVTMRRALVPERPGPA